MNDIDITYARIYSACTKIFFFSLYNIASFIKEHPKEKISFFFQNSDIYLKYDNGHLINIALRNEEFRKIESLVKEGAHHEIEYIKDFSVEKFYLANETVNGTLYLLEQKEQGTLDYRHSGVPVILSEKFKEKFEDYEYALALCVLSLLGVNFNLPCDGAEYQEFLFNGTRFYVQYYFKDGKPSMKILLIDERFDNS